MILAGGLRSRTAASPGETPKHVDAYSGAQRILPAAVAQVLEAGLIYSLRSQDPGIADLHGVFGGSGVVSGLGQHRPADACVLLCVTVKLIAGGEGIVGTDLVVDPRTDVGAGTRVGNAF